ncbi:barstar family protein [Rhodococcus sp. TAF43]|uniref:barstar family protein n=1 Tax=unclassified Rhodococcus (in: high G+C Gram-positive bacteria) TaxID=192944 RepID=UPI00158258DF|nr:barstar family protein [Rhodococcus sp. W8901]QKT12634.1 barstar family protein [Rhodococcus sp. W8901]
MTPGFPRGLSLLVTDRGRAAGIEEDLRAAGRPVRHVRGRRMSTVPALFDEFAAALQFPYYFGRNKDAFDECLGEIGDTVGPDPVVFVLDADALLGEQVSELAWFAEAVGDVPGSIVLQVRPGHADTVVDRCLAVGVHLPRIADPDA